MKVVANAIGFFGSLRQVGDEFEVPEGSKGSWFTPVKAEKPKKPGAAQAAQAQPGDELV